MDLDDLVAFLLQAVGGGELELAISGTNARIHVTSHRSPDSSNVSSSYGSSITAEDLSVAAQQCRQSLKERYPALR
jgi:hypothetical protein